MLRFFFVVLLSSTLMAFGPSGSRESKALRTEMHGLYDSLASIMPLYLNPFKFYDQKNKSLVVGQLKAVNKHASNVRKVLGSEDQELQVLSSSLAHSSKMALVSYQKGVKGQSSFFMGEMLDTCMSCHTSRKSAGDSSFNLLKNVDMSTLDSYGKAKLMTISRRFSQAMSEYESIILKQRLAISDIIHFDPFLNYMVIGIRVRPDVNRVNQTLKAALDRPIPQSIKQDIRTWIKSLNDIKSPSWNKGTQLQQATRLMSKGKSLMDYPRDQSGAIYYLEASRRLKDLLGDKSINSKNKAEAYFLMGKSEMVLGRPFLGLEARRYFETTIRLHPKSKVAREAFRMYEESVMFGYTGSSGIHLPKEEADRLETLRQQAY